MASRPSDRHVQSIIQQTEQRLLRIKSEKQQEMQSKLNYDPMDVEKKVTEEKKLNLIYKFRKPVVGVDITKKHSHKKKEKQLNKNMKQNIENILHKRNKTLQKERTANPTNNTSNTNGNKRMKQKTQRIRRRKAYACESQWKEGIRKVKINTSQLEEEDY